jgi:hypothetical protein
MATVAEFIEVRKSIETLAAQITLSVEHNAAQDSRQRLDDANRQLEALKTMVTNDVQVIAASRLTAQLRDLGTKVARLPVGKTATKKKQQQAV